MAVESKALVDNILLPNSAAALDSYAVPANKRAVILAYSFTNVDTAAAYTFTLHLVPSGGSVANTNMKFNAVTLAAKETKTVGAFDVINAGGAIHGFASTADKIAVHISGREETV